TLFVICFMIATGGLGGIVFKVFSYELYFLATLFFVSFLVFSFNLFPFHTYAQSLGRQTVSENNVLSKKLFEYVMYPLFLLSYFRFLIFENAPDFQSYIIFLILFLGIGSL